MTRHRAPLQKTDERQAVRAVGALIVKKAPRNKGKRTERKKRDVVCLQWCLLFIAAVLQVKHEHPPVSPPHFDSCSPWLKLMGADLRIYDVSVTRWRSSALESLSGSRMVLECRASS